MYQICYWGIPVKIANLPTKLKLCETLENISQEISVSINLNSFSADGKQIKWLTDVLQNSCSEKFAKFRGKDLSQY